MKKKGRKKKYIFGSSLYLSSWAALTSVWDYMSTRRRRECICWIDQEALDDRQRAANSRRPAPQIISLALCHSGEVSSDTQGYCLWDCFQMETEYEIRPFDFPVVMLLKRLNNNAGVDVKNVYIYQAWLSKHQPDFIYMRKGKRQTIIVFDNNHAHLPNWPLLGMRLRLNVTFPSAACEYHPRWAHLIGPIFSVIHLSATQAWP